MNIDITYLHIYAIYYIFTYYIYYIFTYTHTVYLLLKVQSILKLNCFKTFKEGN